MGLGALVRGGADRLDREVTEEEIAALPATDIRVRARDRFVVHNQRLVHSIVPKYLEQGLDYEDLFQHGARGLIKAAVKFDPTQGYKFSTYATWWIRQALTRAVANEGSVIRVPVHMHEQMRKVALAERKLQSQGRSTRPADVAVACDMPVQRVEEIRLLSRRTDSLDRIVGDGAHLGDLVALDRPLPSAEQLVMEQLHHAYLLSFLDRFGEREARILLRRTGLDDGERSTLDDLGKEFGVTRERIRQVEVKAFEALRQMLREAGFGPGHDEVPDPEPRKRATRAQRAARAARAACAAEAARAVRAARAARVARFAEAAGAAQAVGAAGGDLAGAADAAGDGVALAAQAGGRGAGQAIVPPVPGTQGAGGEPGAGQDLVVQPHAARTEDGPSTGVRQAAPAAAPVPDPVPVTALGSAATPGCEPGPETVAAPEPVPAPVPGAAPVSGAVAAGAPVRECGAGEAHAADWERALAIPVQFSGSVAWLSEYALLALGYEELAQVLGRAAADDVVAVLKRRGTLDRPVVTALEVLQKVFDSLKAAGRRPADFLDRSFQALNGASPRSYLAQRPLASRESRLAVRSALREFTQTPAAPAASDAVAGPGVAGPAVTALPVASVEAPEGTGAAETPAATGTAAEPEHATTAATSAAAPSAPAETATVQDPRAGHSAAEWNAALDAEAERRLDELEAALLGRVDRALQRRERSLHREYDARAARLREEADVRLRREREEHQVQTAALMVRLQQAEARTADAEECAAQAGARAARAEERAAQADARVEEAGRQYRTQLNSLEEQLRGARFEVAQRETALRQAEDDAAAATEAVERWAAHRIAETEAATRDAHRWIAELEAQLTALTEAPERRTLRDMWRRS
ncbi:sigma-70 family RNA polymerase sigma factor [Streptomyces sp. NPDC090029]|uniref:sigma-70 family RNA polymerase sigma factor n=1 Tax=Streptomyces sp. NPDC090029 TaxID=3365924 RepID=UPI00382F28FA